MCKTHFYYTLDTGQPLFNINRIFIINSLSEVYGKK